MTVTEQEAKNKWCPMVRSETDGNSINALSDEKRNPEWSRCIGSSCMMMAIKAILLWKIQASGLIRNTYHA